MAYRTRPQDVALGRSGTKWNALRKRVFEEETHCWWCHKWVNQSLPRTHPMSRTADHVLPLWQGGPPLDRANVRLAHRRCNTARNNALMAEARQTQRPAYTVDATAL